MSTNSSLAETSTVSNKEGLLGNFFITFTIGNFQTINLFKIKISLVILYPILEVLIVLLKLGIQGIRNRNFHICVMCNNFYHTIIKFNQCMYI
jgi:hypothetical protein